MSLLIPVPTYHFDYSGKENFSFRNLIHLTAVSVISAVYCNLRELIDALLLQELEKSDCAALRNNLVVAMTDFCVHYTAMIEW